MSEQDLSKESQPSAVTGETDWESFDNAPWASESVSESSIPVLEALAGACDYALRKAVASDDVRAVSDPDRFKAAFGSYAAKAISMSVRESLKATRSEMDRLLNMSDEELIGEIRVGANSSRTAVTARVSVQGDLNRADGHGGSAYASYRLDPVLKAPFINSNVPSAKKRSNG